MQEFPAYLRLRESIFHALNQKAVAKRYAQESGKKYEKLSFIVAHMGGGVSVGVHKNGRVIDVNNALDGEGPFSPERSGGVPIGALNRICHSKEYSPAEMQKKISGHGGMAAYLNTNDFKEVSEKAEAGDQEYRLIYRCFHISSCQRNWKLRHSSIWKSRRHNPYRRNSL